MIPSELLFLDVFFKINARVILCIRNINIWGGGTQMRNDKIGSCNFIVGFFLTF